MLLLLLLLLQGIIDTSQTKLRPLIGDVNMSCMWCSVMLRRDNIWHQFWGRWFAALFGIEDKKHAYIWRAAQYRVHVVAVNHRPARCSGSIVQDKNHRVPWTIQEEVCKCYSIFRWYLLRAFFIADWFLKKRYLSFRRIGKKLNFGLRVCRIFSCDIIFTFIIDHGGLNIHYNDIATHFLHPVRASYPIWWK